MRVNHPESVDVTFSDSAPSKVEVALLLCERTLQRLHTKYHANSTCASTLYAWYIQKVAYINLIRNSTENDEKKDPMSDQNDRRQGRNGTNKQLKGSATPSAEKVGSHGTLNRNRGDIDFFQAYQATQNHGLCEAITLAAQASGIDQINENEEVEDERPTADVVLRNLEEGLFLPPRHPQTPSMMDFHTEAPRDLGFRLLLSLLQACTFHSDVLCFDVGQTLVELFPVDPVENCGVIHPFREPRRNVDVLDLAEELFNSHLDEEGALLALGNATQSFLVWITVAWSCASYEHQTRLAGAVSRWISSLSAVWKTIEAREDDPSRAFAAWVRATARERPLPRFRTMKSLLLENQSGIGPDAGDTSNVVNTSRILRDIFEGHAMDALDMLESLFTRAGTSYLPDNYVAKLLAMQGSAAATLLPRQELLNHGSRLTLFNITCGMLAYVAFYLALRSFDTAEQCASLAIKVGQQLHSNHILALAHYCRFVVQMNSRRVGEAADSIAIALQLAAAEASPSAASEALPIRSVCFASATELLLFFPGVVSGSLRAALSVGLASRRTRPNGEADEDGDGGAPDPHASVERRGKKRAAEGGAAPPSASRAVVVQAIAQTARHGLGLFAAASLLRARRGQAWVEVVAGLARETVGMAGSIYGLTTTPRRLDAGAMRPLLARLDEDDLDADGEGGGGGSPRRPSWILLAEMVRHTGHKLLAVQGGRAWGVVAREHGPLHLARRFLRAVRLHYGDDALRRVEANVFLAPTLRYVQGCWLARNGFVAAAYDLLESTAHSLYALAGAPNPNERGRMAREVGLRAGEQGTTLNLSYEKLLAGYLQKCAGGESAGRFFWPPDLLLLLAEIQHKRGELALYAGYANAIDDMAEVLDVISASCSFVYGTLVSQLLQLMSLQQRFDFSGILQRSAKLLAAAEAVGFTHLAESIRVRQATTLRCTGQWIETLELLQQLQHTSRLFEPWQLLTRLTAGCEALLASAALLPPTDAITTTATDVVGRFLEEGIRELQVRGYLGMLEEVLQRHFSTKNAGRNESVGVSLPELLCIHASAARSIDIFLSGKFSDPHGISYCSSSIQTCSRQLSEVLCERHQLRHVHEWFSQRGALEICEILLNGELGMHDS